MAKRPTRQDKLRSELVLPSPTLPPKPKKKLILKGTGKDGKLAKLRKLFLES